MGQEVLDIYNHNTIVCTYKYPVLFVEFDKDNLISKKGHQLKQIKPENFPYK